MAEDLTSNRLTLKSRKLVNCEKVIRQAIEQASETSPLETFLTMQVTHLKEAWNEYEEAMVKLQEVASHDNVEVYQQFFDRSHYDYEIARQQAETSTCLKLRRNLTIRPWLSPMNQNVLTASGTWKTSLLRPRVMLRRLPQVPYGPTWRAFYELWKTSLPGYSFPPRKQRG